jgi:predicted DNA-binding ribbon-helix-helix protein
MKSSIQRHTIIIDGHKTTVSLENAFWRDLKEIAHAQEATLSELVAKIDQTRQTRQQAISPRQSACTCWNTSVGMDKGTAINELANAM